MTLSPVLLDFLNTGRLGGLLIGMTEESVREMLGDPDDVSCARGRSRILKFVALELSFHDGVLFLICIYPKVGRFRLPSALSETELKVPSIEQLMRIGIVLEPFPALTFENQSAGRSKGGVQVISHSKTANVDKITYSGLPA